MKADKQWEKIGFKHHHGIAVPLFSLHTKNSLGIGEFLDLIPLIDWCQSLSFDLIQLLPLNDTGSDPSPYNPLSSCALDPIYLSLSALPEPLDLAPFAPFLDSPRLALHDIKRAKLDWLHTYFNKNVFSKEISEFREEHPWVEEYALFKALKDEYGGKHWREWPQKYQHPSQEAYREKQKTAEFHIFVQSLCFRQMREVKAYAEKKGVFLKGDLPILVSPDSVGVWAKRDFFNLSLVAGAPPDYYNALGQKWGFPLFNWDAIRKSDFAWWKQKLHVLEELYHLYRIDHVVGLFRIWAIPPDKKASEGFFVPKDPTLWEPQGREVLEMMLKNCSLLPIAEDLGTIPNHVRPCLHEFGIASTKVIRWQRRWETDQHFIPYSEYDPISLTTVSTIDSDLTKMWWQKFPEEALLFSQFKKWRYTPNLEQDQLLAILQDSHHTTSLFHANLLQEYLSLFPDLIDPNLDNERVNIPGTLLPTNWTSRYRVPLETIVQHDPLRHALRKIRQ